MQEDDEFTGQEIFQEQPKSIAELYVYSIQRSFEEGGSKSLRRLFGAVNYATTMLGSVVNPTTGLPKYPLDHDGNYKDPTLKKIMDGIYEKKIMETQKGKWGKDGQLDVTVGDEFQMRATVNTVEIVTEQAKEFAFEMAVRKVSKNITKLTHILGQEGLLPPHTILSDIAQENMLDGVLHADLDPWERVKELAMELAEEDSTILAEQKVAQILKEREEQAKEEKNTGVE
jgi:hypothetical protein